LNQTLMSDIDKDSIKSVQVVHTVVI